MYTSLRQEAAIVDAEVKDIPLNAKEMLKAVAKESVEVPKSKTVVDDRMKLRFVRVDDSIFKIPINFFLEMPYEIHRHLLFSTDSTNSRGMTPENPIRLRGHSAEQFRHLLDAYNSYPSIDVSSMLQGHFLAIGELSLIYRLRALAAWFLPHFSRYVLSHETPLRTAADPTYVRYMKLALGYNRPELVASISAKWISRMHWHELDPLSALMLADVYGIIELLSHACYMYLVSVERRIKHGQRIDERGILTHRQTRYIMAGYHSLRVYGKRLMSSPPSFGSGVPTGECSVNQHKQCAEVWRLRWKDAVGNVSTSLSEVDILSKLIRVEQALKDDKLLSSYVMPACRTLALTSVKKTKDLVARQLHHHFDL